MEQLTKNGGPPMLLPQAVCLVLNFLIWELHIHALLIVVDFTKQRYGGMSMGCYQSGSMPNSFCLLPL